MRRADANGRKQSKNMLSNDESSPTITTARLSHFMYHRRQGKLKCRDVATPDTQSAFCTCTNGEDSKCFNQKGAT